ncbi:RidA family protein [Pseudoduganella violacea]|uniref:Enamine deaminase RidA (YjgF/YER057c/UK114 family) n=1 Tax=Pseudoduganella violacea TaxID=1715466 RepID=A0A7W5FVP1_9BURK|nr:RidA family protein [Pseudoduganella violacea]MBB3120994.1 enamine deaminase RidA (YjgF/YER057c/UK114 family) [Pseudoduganella violacea]
MHMNPLPFSKYCRAGGLVFLSGELPLGPDGAIPAGIEAQTSLVLERIGGTLSGIGLGLQDIVQVTVYLTHAEDFAAFNATYQRHFAAPYPVRTTVVAPLVLPGARVEITVVAEDKPPHAGAEQQ